MNAGVLSRTLARAPAIAASAIVVAFSVAGVARAEDDSAKILQASTNYVAGGDRARRPVLAWLSASVRPR